MPNAQYVSGWLVEGPAPPEGGWQPPKPPAGGVGGRPPITKPLPPLPPEITEPEPPAPDEGTAPEHPIFIPERPGKPPIQLPPGAVWPPFNPGDGIQGKALLFCWVPGVGKKWIVVDVPAGGVGNPPPRPQPK